MDESLTRRQRLGAWLVAIPYLVLVVCAGGLVVTAGASSYAWLMWLYGLWFACLVCVPMATWGAVIGHQEGSRTMKIWGIIGAIVCLPGALLALFLLTAVGS